ncbi:NAD(P)-binding protein [Sorangium sp. So ce1389]|uniref:NAD(P)-binding protein n=1 Tax=Sorangium sp. So ce1389 TaxID=3133336 RepID=UPI003F5E3C92
MGRTAEREAANAAEHAQQEQQQVQQQSTTRTAEKPALTSVTGKQVTDGMSFDWIVVGGGIAGLMAAVAIQNKFPSASILILEKAADTGGRIKDVTWTAAKGLQRVEIANPVPATDPVVPVGGVRIDPSQNLTLHLFNWSKGEYEADYYQDWMALYDDTTGERKVVPAGGDEHLVIFGYPKTLDEAYKFRFQGDFQSTDPNRYKEFSGQDVASREDYYPTKGFSQMAQAVQAEFNASTTSYTLVECPATGMDYTPATSTYTITIQHEDVTYDFTSTGLVVAVPPMYIKQMDGAVATWLNGQDFVYETKAVPVTTVTMWYEYQWWTQLRESYGSNFARMWDHFSPLIHIEFFNDSYKLLSKAIRVSYADGSAADIFGNPQRGGDKNVPDDEALAHLKQALTDALAIFSVAPPDPLYTHIEHHPCAWHFEWPDAKNDIFKKQFLVMLLKFAAPTIIGSNVYLVGEAYNPQRTWIQGALESVVLSLQFLADDMFWGPNVPEKTYKMLGLDVPLQINKKKQRVACMCHRPGWNACTKCTHKSSQYSCDEKLAMEWHRKHGGHAVVAVWGLARGQELHSHDGRFKLIHQLDGNVVLYKGHSALWATNTSGETTHLIMQDGNLVLFNGATPLWSSNTKPMGGKLCVLREDGDVVIYNAKDEPVWDTHTGKSDHKH